MFAVNVSSSVSLRAYGSIELMSEAPAQRNVAAETVEAAPEAATKAAMRTAVARNDRNDGIWKSPVLSTTADCLVQRDAWHAPQSPEPFNRALRACPPGPPTPSAPPDGHGRGPTPSSPRCRGSIAGAAPA